ncbi:MAG: multicopper oxidase family protein, partial [Parvibaculaceae bacterium]
MLAGAGVAGLLSRPGSGETLPEPSGRSRALSLRAAERPARLLGPQGPESRLWSFGDELYPVIRIGRGDRVLATLDNALPEHTTIHWHGIRLANAMDGVPYMTQPPVEPGQRFLYDFTAPDAGTFFFHPHCNESGQVGHGLMGLLIVEGDEPEPRDGEVILAVKDWRLNPDGTFLPFVTEKGAPKAGTFGTVRTVNGMPKATQAVPASADIRIRILNLDATRVLEVGVEGGPAAIVAVDGNAIAPVPLDTWRMGPAMRLDLVARTPKDGAKLKVIDYNVAEPYVVAELEARGADRRSRDFSPPPLVASDIPEPDLVAAEAQSYIFGAAGDPAGSLPVEPS